MEPRHEPRHAKQEDRISRDAAQFELPRIQSVIFEDNVFSMYIDCEPECRMLPTPREFSRHILSDRTTQAASNKRRLHPVTGGISL